MRKSRRQIANEWAAAKQAAKAVVEVPVEVKTTHSFVKEETFVDSSLLEEDAAELEHAERSSRTKTRRVKSDAINGVKAKPKKAKRKPRKPKKKEN
tara:strand:+ start:1156 stop:1443 length:288 start_codon:yes stop_codon:yes gene_type:complete